MPDYLQNGNDGALPEGFAVWRRGVTYTVRPEIRSPLLSGREYLINATVRRKIVDGERFTAYGDLYRRCVAILRARSAEVRGSDESECLHAWVQWHAWWRGAIFDKYPGAGNHTVACSSITIGLAYLKKGDPKPQGQNTPEPAQLVRPGGIAAESLFSRNAPRQRFDEVYIDFDFNGHAAASPDTTFSYGEYVPSTYGINFEPFVQRAEGLAKFHSRSLSQEGSAEILRREWFHIAASNFIVVMLYFRL